MATVKIKFRPSSVDGKEGTVYYQVIHVRVARQISTSYRLFPAEWDKRRARIVAAPSDEGRRQHLSLLEGKIMEDTDRLEGIITTLERRRGLLRPTTWFPPLTADITACLSPSSCGRS